MHVSTLLEMAADGFGDRVAFTSATTGTSLTYADLLDRSRRAAAWIAAKGVDNVGLVDVNSEAVPILLYGSGIAGKPFVPMNYRLADEQLRAIVTRTAPSVVVVDEGVPARLGDIDGVEIVGRDQFLAELDDVEPGDALGFDPDDIAILLFTSGTTGEPKAAVLRHKHLTSYVVGSVEYMGADEEEAALVSVPPYHVAGTSAVLSSVFAGRRVVYLPAFSPEDWVRTASEERVTQAMVVPTMLNRLLDIMERDDEQLPAMRHLAYGGGRMPVPVIERALGYLPHVNFVNAYGLTETSSTIAVLGPDDHRAAFGSDDPNVRRRLGSVGQPLPTLEVEIRDENGSPVKPGEQGELWVRGEQVAGEYLGRRGSIEEGWFPTRDSAMLDDDGYLYLAGRIDDVIVRGAENLSPGEIEETLQSHPAVDDACVVGVPDTEWGEKVVAAVVLKEGASATEAELQAFVREQLRSSKTPERIDVLDELPYNEMGKLLRRVVKADLAGKYGSETAAT